MNPERLYIQTFLIYKIHIYQYFVNFVAIDPLVLTYSNFCYSFPLITVEFDVWSEGSIRVYTEFL